MLRALVLALLVANLGFWAWSAGALSFLGLGPTSERDPTRLAQQLRPEAVRVLPPTAATDAQAATVAAATPASAAAHATAQCLEAGPFAQGSIEAAERALTALALPEGSWVRTTQARPPLFGVVLGPFATRDALQKKREEIARLQLPLEALELPGDSGAAAQPGLAMGRYDSREAAETALATFSKRGVRTARIALLRAAASESRLRVETATAAQAEQLRALNQAALGAGFGPCAPLVAAAR